MLVNRMPVLAIWIALIASLGIGVTDCISAPAIQGIASVIDGDTIEIGGERIRLDAIDAPESSQLCLDAASKRYRCGQKSAFALADMIGRSVVSCAPKGRDLYKCLDGPAGLGGSVLEAWKRFRSSGRRGAPCAARDLGRLIRDAVGLAGTQQMSSNAEGSR